VIEFEPQFTSMNFNVETLSVHRRESLMKNYVMEPDSLQTSPPPRLKGAIAGSSLALLRLQRIKYAPHC
jgi:hypothetical protein